MRGGWVAMGHKMVAGTLLLLLGLFGVGAATAGAQGYAGNATLVCSPLTVAPGGVIGLVLTGASPGVEVTFSYNPTLGTAVADETGTATLDAVIPDAASEGPIEISASWSDGGVDVTATCPATVGAGEGAEVLGVAISAGGPQAASQSLPATGSDSTLPLAQIGIVLVVAGTAVALVARKRSTARAADPVA